MGRTWWPLNQRAREILTIAVAVATVVGVMWGIGASVISGLENRLIDRLDRLERAMAEGFEQSHQRMDRIEGRMDRIDADVDAIDADGDAIEKHLLRIGSALETDRAPAETVPALAAPDRRGSPAGAVEPAMPSVGLLSGEH